MKLWEPGKTIALREIRKGRVFSMIPLRVMQDSESDWGAFLLPMRTVCKWPRKPDGGWARLREKDWILSDEPWPLGTALYLIQAGAGYTVIAFWNDEQIFDHWKINLEEPIRRTPLGFDYMDQMLDIIINANRSQWHWKDEDELAQAQTLGIFSPEEALEIRAKGERVIQSMQANEPPFDGNWENWKPNPAWLTPIDLPQGWDQV